MYIVITVTSHFDPWDDKVLCVNTNIPTQTPEEGGSDHLQSLCLIWLFASIEKEYGHT